jgi:hypothetical protein
MTSPARRLWGRELLEGTLPTYTSSLPQTARPRSAQVRWAALFDGDALVAMRAILYTAAGVLVVGFVAVGRAKDLSRLGGGESGGVGFLECDQTAGELEQREVVLVFL